MMGTKRVRAIRRSKVSTGRSRSERLFPSTSFRKPSFMSDAKKQKDGKPSAPTTSGMGRLLRRFSAMSRTSIRCCE